MDVAGALFHRLRDDRVHQADDRRLARHVAQMLEILGRLAAVEIEIRLSARAESP